MSFLLPLLSSRSMMGQREFKAVLWHELSGFLIKAQGQLKMTLRIMIDRSAIHVHDSYSS